MFKVKFAVWYLYKFGDYMEEKSTETSNKKNRT